LTKRWRTGLSVALAVVLLLAVAARLLVGPILLWRLQAMALQHLHAQLSVAEISYEFPHVLVARGLHLAPMAGAAANDSLDIAEVRVTLARLPLRRGPLLVKELLLSRPTVRIVRNAGAADLGRILSSQTQATSRPPTAAPSKISTMIQLQHAIIQDGKLILEDRAAPAAWSGQFNADVVARGPADYVFAIGALGPAADRLRAQGAVNVDDRLASVQHFVLTAQADPKVPLPLIGKWLEPYQARGSLRIEASARFSGADPAQNQASATLTLQDGSAFAPPLGVPLESLQLVVQAALGRQGITARVSQLSAHSGNARFFLDEGAMLSLDGNRWSLQKIHGLVASDGPVSTAGPLGEQLRRLEAGGTVEFSCVAQGPFSRSIHWRDVQGQVLLYPHQVSIRPSGFSRPISGLDGGTIGIADGTASITDLRGLYGNDQWVGSARLSLSALRQGTLRCRDIDASINFHPPSPVYPEPLASVFDQLSPGGLYNITGWADWLPAAAEPNVDYDLHVSCDGASAAITRRKVTLTQVKVNSELFPDHLQISQLDCQGLGGKISGHGRVACTRPYPFSGEIATEGCDLSQIAGLLNASESEQARYQGLADVQAVFEGSGPSQGETAAQLFGSDGQFEIYQANLWDIPALQRIAARVSIARKALTVSRAAAFFRVADQRVHLKDAALSAPVLGMQGSGTVGFDGQLDLDVVVAPLADWQDKIDKSGVPLVSDVAGDVADRIQKLLNKATGDLLYKFHVSGTASDPQLTTVAAPAITQPAARLFGSMLKPSPQNRLLKLLSPTTQPTTQPAPSK